MYNAICCRIVELFLVDSQYCVGGYPYTGYRTV